MFVIHAACNIAVELIAKNCICKLSIVRSMLENYSNKTVIKSALNFGCSLTGI